MSYRLVSEGIADYASVWVRFLSSKKKKGGGSKNRGFYFESRQPSLCEFRPLHIGWGVQALALLLTTSLTLDTSWAFLCFSLLICNMGDRRIKLCEALRMCWAGREYRRCANHCWLWQKMSCGMHLGRLTTPQFYVEDFTALCSLGLIVPPMG